MKLIGADLVLFNLINVEHKDLTWVPGKELKLAELSNYCLLVYTEVVAFYTFPFDG